MICNDMWGAADEIGIGFCERHLVEFSIELIFHATNGIKSWIESTNKTIKPG